MSKYVLGLPNKQQKIFYFGNKFGDYINAFEQMNLYIDSSEYADWELEFVKEAHRQAAQAIHYKLVPKA